MYKIAVGSSTVTRPGIVLKIIQPYYHHLLCPLYTPFHPFNFNSCFLYKIMFNKMLSQYIPINHKNCVISFHSCRILDHWECHDTLSPSNDLFRKAKIEK